jgi:hypothetical protein
MTVAMQASDLLLGQEGAFGTHLCQRHRRPSRHVWARRRTPGSGVGDRLASGLSYRWFSRCLFRFIWGGLG